MSEAEDGGIFMSYRRQESSYAAGRLYDRLADRFGADQVFIDVDTIEPGVDFAEAIGRAVETCEVLLAIIGPGWLMATDERGSRRLEDQDDIVRIEIEAALSRNVRVIPILLENAVMPKRQDLPESLASLARRNSFTVRHESFRYDAERLVAAIERVLAAPAAAAPAAAAPGTPETRSREQPGTTARPRTTARPVKTGQPKGRSEGSVTKSIKWQLEHVAKEGPKTTFRLSSGSKSHLIVIKMRYYFGGDMIEIDGVGVVKAASISGNTYSLRKLSSRIGSDVAIKVDVLDKSTGVSITLKIGNQVLTCRP